MNIPKKLEVKRDEQAEEFYKRSGWVPTELAVMNYQAGFSDCANLLLPEIEKMHTALKEWIAFEHSQMDKEGPYVGMEINRLIKQGDKALQSLREFLGSEAENE